MRIEEKEGALVITDFDEMEACKIACKIEKDGIHFYRRLAERAADSAVRGTLETLLAQERDHLRFFGSELERLRAERRESHEEDDLLSGIDYGIFQPYMNMEDLDKIVNAPEKALRLGLAVENKSILFYESCLSKVGSSAARGELARIIAEERGHKRLLEEMLKSIGARDAQGG